jgi:hypothetical protein
MRFFTHGSEFQVVVTSHSVAVTRIEIAHRRPIDVSRSLFRTFERARKRPGRAGQAKEKIKTGGPGPGAWAHTMLSGPLCAAVAPVQDGTGQRSNRHGSELRTPLTPSPIGLGQSDQIPANGADPSLEIGLEDTFAKRQILL